MNTPPKNDAAPGGAGAGVNGPNTSPEFMHAPMMPPVRRDAPSTSREAARRIAGHSGKQRSAVLAFIRGRGTFGATDAEIVTGVGIPIQSVNPRRGELAQLGAIVLNGQYRLTPSGRRARVWVAREYALPATEGQVKP